MSYDFLKVNKGRPCDCPARRLSEKLVGTECEICAGIVPPLSADQLRWIKAEKERAASAEAQGEGNGRS